MGPKIIPISGRRAASSWAASLLVGVFCLLLAQIGIAQSSQQPKAAHAAPPPTSDGRPLFESRCAACHGLDGRGGERGPDIATRPQIVQLSDQELGEILRQGRPAAGMPPFVSLGSANLKTLLSYVRFLQGKDSATVLAGNALNGRVLFFGKAKCADCHMVQGEGGFVGRDLSAYGTTLSAREIRRYIVAPAESTSGGKRMTTAKLYDSQQITGIVRNEDNFSLQLQLLDGAFRFLSKSEIAAIESSPEPIMPTNYGSILTAAEVDDLVKYLRTVAIPEAAPKHDWGDDE
jgi:cytochrome c oxidase cbb3-type subunit III